MSEEDLRKNPHYKLSDPNIKTFVSKEDRPLSLVG